MAVLCPDLLNLNPDVGKGTTVLIRRRATDTAGQMSASGLLMGGKAYYVFKDQYERNRWGDYNGIGLDPSDPDSVWVYGEYAQKKVVWQTRFGRVSYDSVPTEPQRRLVPRDIRY